MDYLVFYIQKNYPSKVKETFSENKMQWNHLETTVFLEGWISRFLLAVTYKTIIFLNYPMSM